MKVFRKITSIVMSVIIAISSAISVGAYNMTGNDMLASGEANIGESIWYNITDLISETSAGPFNVNVWGYVKSDSISDVAETAINDIIDGKVAAFAKANDAAILYDIVKTGTVAAKAWQDLISACKQLPGALNDYESKVSLYFKAPVNSFLTISSAIQRSVNNGNTLSDDDLSRIQTYWNQQSDGVEALRSMSKKWRYWKHKSELINMANILESFCNNVTAKGVYQAALKTKRDTNTFAYFDKCSTNSASSCVSMIMRYKGSNVSQQSIFDIGGTFDWSKVEGTYQLNDNGSFTGLNRCSRNEQLLRIANSMSYTNTPGVLKLLPINEDNYTSYVLVIGVDGNDLRIVDPFFNGSTETAQQYADRNGYSVDKFFGRLDCFWAYI